MKNVCGDLDCLSEHQQKQEIYPITVDHINPLCIIGDSVSGTKQNSSNKSEFRR